jgi:hypothetical protein
MSEINIDRFSGEAAEPPVWGSCGYCGAPIYEGSRYKTHDGLNICGGCEARYAYSRFEEDAARQTAISEVGFNE